jgi:4-alpha-glucanotransferase
LGYQGQKRVTWLLLLDCSTGVSALTEDQDYSSCSRRWGNAVLLDFVASSITKNLKVLQAKEEACKIQQDGVSEMCSSAQTAPLRREA